MSAAADAKAFAAGDEVESVRAIAASFFLVEKGMRGVVVGEEKGWIFVRFGSRKAVIPVLPAELRKVDAVADHATPAGLETAASAVGVC